MKTKRIVFNFFMWVTVIAQGLWVGGTFFHMVVMQPMWTYNPPASVYFFFTQTRFNQTIWNFYGPPWMMSRLVPLILCTVTGWKFLGKEKKIIIFSISCWVFITAFTLIYIYPINNVLFLQAGGNNSPGTIQAMVNKWLLADRIRFAIGTAGYGCLLYVFRKVQHDSIGSHLTPSVL